MPRSPEAPTATVPGPAGAQEDGARDHSGRLLVRMPKSLHAELASAAERDGTSLNGFIVGALSGAVRWRAPADDAPAQQAPAAPPDPLSRPDGARRLALALKANLVLLAVAIAVAAALLVTAWPGGRTGRAG